MKILKILLIAAIVFCQGLYLNYSKVNAAEGLSITVDNQFIQLNQKPEFIDGKVLVPAKEVIEALGGSFEFQQKTLSGVIKYQDNEIVYRLDNSLAKHNGKLYSTELPMKIINYRVFIPLESVCDRLGVKLVSDLKRNQMLLFRPIDGKINYKVSSGDYLWLIAMTFNTSISEIKTLNNLTTDNIYIGQMLYIKYSQTSNFIFDAYTSKSMTIFKGPGFSNPSLGYLSAWTLIKVIGKNGDWYKISTSKGMGYAYSSVVYIKQDITDNLPDSDYFKKNIPVDTSGGSITYSNYVVKKGDTLWSIAQSYYLPVTELLTANKLTSSSSISIGQNIIIPFHNIPVKPLLAYGKGEILDWFKEAQYVFPIGKQAKFIDLQTGKSFYAKRTMGASHADVETLSIEDTASMKEIFGEWSWSRRPFLIDTGDRIVAASVSGMPHAGLDNVPFMQNTDGRSDNWGYGPNYDSIKGNVMDGHFDVYFLNCLRHVDNNYDQYHQFNVLISGGLN